MGWPSYIFKRIKLWIIPHLCETTNVKISSHYGYQVGFHIWTIGCNPIWNFSVFSCKLGYAYKHFTKDWIRHLIYYLFLLLVQYIRNQVCKPNRSKYLHILTTHSNFLYSSIFRERTLGRHHHDIFNTYLFRCIFSEFRS